MASEIRDQWHSGSTGICCFYLFFIVPADIIHVMERPVLAHPAICFCKRNSQKFRGGTKRKDALLPEPGHPYCNYLLKNGVQLNDRYDNGRIELSCFLHTF